MSIAYDETKHLRGGNPANTGEYSAKVNSAPESALPAPTPLPEELRVLTRAAENFFGPLVRVETHPTAGGALVHDRDGRAWLVLEVATLDISVKKHLSNVEVRQRIHPETAATATGVPSQVFDILSDHHHGDMLLFETIDSTVGMDSYALGVVESEDALKKTFGRPSSRIDWVSDDVVAISAE